MTKPRPAPFESTLGPEFAATAHSVSVENHGINHTLDLRAYARDADGNPVIVSLTLPADVIPGFMTQVVQAGGYAMKDIADAWRRGDCDTCGNRRLVDVPRPGTGGRMTNMYCPDCSGPQGTKPLEGFPTLRHPGSQEGDRP